MGVACERQAAFERKDLVAKEAAGPTSFCRKANIMLIGKKYSNGLFGESIQSLCRSKKYLLSATLSVDFVVGFSPMVCGEQATGTRNGVDEKFWHFPLF